jgi:O-antigen/teichoic acid export membrane protein
VQQDNAPAGERHGAVTTSLRKGFVWATAGNVVYVTCQYGTLVALAKLGTPEDVGTFALALAVTAPIVVFSQMQLRQLQVTDVRREARFGDYLASRLASTAAALAIIAGIVVVVGYDNRTAAVMLSVALAKAFESVADIAHGRLQHVERMDLIARSLAIKGVVSLAAFTAALALGGSLLVAVMAMAFVWAGMLVGFDLVLARRFTQPEDRKLTWRADVMQRLARTALPLAVASGLGSFSGNLPRYVLDAMIGKEAVAVFAVAATPLAMISLVWTAVAQTTLPRAAVYFSSGQNGPLVSLAAKVVLLQVLAAAVVSAIFALYGEGIMRLLFAPEYAEAGPITALMAAGMAAGGLGAYGSTILTAGRRFSLQLWNIVVVVLAQLPLCFILIGAAGTWGAGWSEVGRFAVSALYLIVAGVAVHRRAAGVWRTQGEKNWNARPLTEA